MPRALQPGVAPLHAPPPPARQLWAVALVALSCGEGLAGVQRPAPVRPLLAALSCDSAQSATLSEVQRQVFSPRCASCHTASGIGPYPMSTGSETASLVGRTSGYGAALRLVDPGHPENSTL